MPRIYLSPPELVADELTLLTDAVRSGWIAPMGPDVDAFEAEMCAKLGMEHALAVSSGTAALHLALLAIGAGPGDEIWVSDLTFAASANAVRYVGATPVFLDSDLATWNRGRALVERALDDAASRGQLPKAVIVVDLYGQCAAYPRISAACRKHGVLIIEDAAEALGASIDGRAAGSFGDLAILSFNGNKIITTSGGGMLLARRPEWVQRARHLATQAREPVRHYEHKDVGYNYRLSNLLAAVGRGQLRDLDRKVNARRENNRLYRELLGKLPGWSFMPEPAGYRSTFWLSTATIDPAQFGASRDVVLERLAAQDIEARPVWKPMHMQAIYREYRCVGGEVGEALFERGICLPSGSSLTAEQLHMIVDVIASCPTA